MAAGAYFFVTSQGAADVSAALGVGTLRLSPWLVQRTIPIARLGAEVATVGEAGSKFRITLYGDTGSTYPGALIVDAGQIAGDVADRHELTVSTTLQPGLYWVGGVVQAVTTTQPTMRTVLDWHAPAQIPMGATLATVTANAKPVCLTTAGVTGAAPASFPAGASQGGIAGRIFARSA